MTSKKRTVLLLPLLAIAAVVTLGVAGCAPRVGGASPSDGAVQDSPGITDSEIQLGITAPLSGPLAAAATQALEGYEAYIDRLNDAGGVTFGDGKTRKIEVKAYDDAYDPAKAVANINQEIAEGKFANVGSSGTATAVATMSLENESKFPSVLLLAGAPILSQDQKANPYTLAFLPTYASETRAFGKYLASLGKPITVAMLTQNDDSGKAWSEGFRDGIKGSQVKVVDEETVESSDPQADSQMAKLAATKADVFVEANGLLSIIPQSMLKAQQLGWTPSVFFTSVSSNAKQSIIPGNGKAFPAIYSAAFAKDPNSPSYANDPDVVQFKADLKKYASPATASNPIGQAVWGYQVGAALEAAFKGMKQPTRDAFLGSLRSLKALELPLALKGVTFNGTDLTLSAMSQSVAVQRYDFEQSAYIPVK